MESINRKLKRVQKLQSRIAIIVTEIQQELECLALQENENIQNSPPMKEPEHIDWASQVQSEDWGSDANHSTNSPVMREHINWASQTTTEDWGSEANHPAFSLTSANPSRNRRSAWKNKCPVCYSTNCEH